MTRLAKKSTTSRKRRAITTSRIANKTILRVILNSGDITYQPVFGWSPNDALTHRLMFDAIFTEHVNLLGGKSVLDITQLINNLQNAPSDELERMWDLPSPDATTTPRTLPYKELLSRAPVMEAQKDGETKPGNRMEGKKGDKGDKGIKGDPGKEEEEGVPGYPGETGPMGQIDSPGIDGN